MKIPAAYISRVPDYQILQEAGSALLRHQILKQQLLFHGHIVRLGDADILRRALIVPGDIRPAHFAFRNRGAPKHCWHDRIFEEAKKVAGDLDRLRVLIRQDGMWKAQVNFYIDKERKRCEIGAF